jgi:two-component system, chemotaxis family, response regulator Rcp1
MLEQNHIQVLIVEDNQADVRMVKALVEETGLFTNITVIRDGEGAIQMMERVAKGESQAPDLILLDINLPRKNGHEVLAYIRGNDRIATTCVVMCTGCASLDDKAKAHDNGANAYLIKPLGLLEMDEMVVNLRCVLTSLNEGSVFAKCF